MTVGQTRAKFDGVAHKVVNLLVVSFRKAIRATHSGHGQCGHGRIEHG